MRHFGTTAAGQKVEAIDIAAGDLRATILTRGGILQDVRVEGIDNAITLGSEDIADYEAGMAYFGALIAPVANRLSQARAPIAGQIHAFPPNQNGTHLLHSGTAGAHTKIWSVIEAGDSAVTLACDLADGEGGFPGNRRIEARFDALPPATLRLTLRATTDAPTLMNIANHSYWNLDGSETWAGHRLRIAAEHYLPTDDDVIPTGEIAPVTGTQFDFRAGRVITPDDTALDHNLCLSEGKRPLREVLWLTGTKGATMALATTEPGLQVFDGRTPGKTGAPVHEALAIEAQGWPDAPNNPDFPQIELAAGDRYEQLTEWRFSRP